jgi:hypothetical protein
MRLQLLSTRAPSLRLVAATALGALCVAGREARAQSRGAPPGARVAVLDLAFYGARANSLEPGDSALAATATATVRAALGAAAGVALADSAAVAAAASTPDAAATASGRPCNVVVACARVVGRALGARWAVMGKVSKTSNLIWLFSGQLIDVATGELTLDDEYELKGVASEMVPAGARVFARRVAKRVAAEVAPAATPTVRSAAPASTTPR